MADFRDLLHDQIDSQEEFRIKARLIIESLRGELAGIVAETGDTEHALEIIAAMAEDELADLTTDAVHASAEFAMKRSKFAKGDV